LHFALPLDGAVLPKHVVDTSVISIRN